MNNNQCKICVIRFDSIKLRERYGLKKKLKVVNKLISTTSQHLIKRLL